MGGTLNPKMERWGAANLMGLRPRRKFPSKVFKGAYRSSQKADGTRSQLRGGTYAHAKLLQVLLERGICRLSRGQIPAL
jgi:hypothetical protein